MAFTFGDNLLINGDAAADITVGWESSSGVTWIPYVGLSSGAFSFASNAYLEQTILPASMPNATRAVHLSTIIKYVNNGPPIYAEAIMYLKLSITTADGVQELILPCSTVIMTGNSGWLTFTEDFEVTFTDVTAVSVKIFSTTTTVECTVSLVDLRVDTSLPSFEQTIIEYVNNATQLITGAKGGFVLLDPSEKPSRILIMDTNDKDTAQNVWQWNSNGLGFSSTGINGPYGTAITMDGSIVANVIAVTGNSGNTTLPERLTEIESNVTYKVDIISSGGMVCSGDGWASTLVAVVYRGTENVTELIDANRFRWTRTSRDAASDTFWNTSHFGGTKSIIVTHADAVLKSTFKCEIMEE
jgi:hypothetical protein